MSNGEQVVEQYKPRKPRKPRKQRRPTTPHWGRYAYATEGRLRMIQSRIFLTKSVREALLQEAFAKEVSVPHLIFTIIRDARPDLPWEPEHQASYGEI